MKRKKKRKVTLKRRLQCYLARCVVAMILIAVAGAVYVLAGGMKKVYLALFGQEQPVQTMQTGNVSMNGTDMTGDLDGNSRNQKSNSDKYNRDDTGGNAQGSPVKSDNTGKQLILSKDRVLVLVNKENPVPEDYQVDLHLLKNGQYVAEEMYEDLKNMLFTGEEEVPGVSFIVASGYRTSTKQRQLFVDEVKKNRLAGMGEEEAYEDAAESVAIEGYSEHETGLCVDIVAETNQRMDETQQYTKENEWLMKHCADYGFILRYPEGQENITGYMYESWHFRYVGKEVAKEIMERGITLEEYLEE